MTTRPFGASGEDPQTQPVKKSGGVFRRTPKASASASTPAAPATGVPPDTAGLTGFWTHLVQTGAIQGDPNYYISGAASPGEVAHALDAADQAFAPEGGIWHHLVAAGVIQGDPNYYATGQASPGEVAHALQVADQGFSGTGNAPTAPVGPDAGIGAPPVVLTNATIPQGGRLVRIANPEGSDAPFVYSYVLPIYGVDVAFEIGDEAAFAELFPEGVGAFSDFSTVPQNAFDQAFVVGGTLRDSGFLGVAESAQSIVEREFRGLKQEGLASWVQDSPQVISVLIQANAQQWSSGKTWTELLKVEETRQRFGAIDRYLSRGFSVEAAVDQYLQDETLIVNGLRKFRGAQADTSPSYIAEVLTKGWDPQTAVNHLEAAHRLLRNPDALRQANEILLATGMQTIDEAGFTSVILGYAPPDVTEVLNTAFAAQALRQTGFEDVNIQTLLDVVDDSSTLRSPDDFKEVARDLSVSVARFTNELQRQTLGIEEDDLVAAFFGRESPSGKSAGEVLNTLARFERDRQAAASGYGGHSAFIDARNRLRVQGVQAL